MALAVGKNQSERYYLGGVMESMAEGEQIGTLAIPKVKTRVVHVFYPI